MWHIEGITDTGRSVLTGTMARCKKGDDGFVIAIQLQFINRQLNEETRMFGWR
jgi:hypothetical protein